MLASRLARTVSVLLLALAVGHAAPALAGAPAAPKSPAPDYSGWQALLDQYARRVVVPNQPPEILFDYEQLYVDEGIWTKKASARLQQVHEQLFAVPPATMDERTRLAWALNAYNFLAIERVTLRLLIPNRGFHRILDVGMMNYADGPFFDSRMAEADGRPWTLNELERRYVYGDSTPLPDPRRRPGDPRLAFALCRVSMGGPLLYPRAFKPESLDAQLDAVTRASLALPRMVRFDEATGTLLASNFIAEHRIDFGDGPAGLLSFLQKYGPPAVRNGIRKHKLADVTRYFPVDPTLNQSPRAKAPAPVDPGKAPKP